jgi:phosphonate transport system ATP-binding protein
MARATGFALEAVTVRYRARAALDDVTLRVRAGEAVAVVGPSGAGKTTLLRLLNGSVRPASGVVKIGDRTLSSLSDAELRRTRASIGFIHQDLRLVSNVRVVQNVIAGRLGHMTLAASLRAMLLPPRALVMEAHDVLERVGIPEKLYDRTDRLSGGQRQRVAIARALFQRPAVLIADEPVSSVDPARARDAVRLLTTLCAERGLTLCVSLHNLELAREFFPRLVGLRAGRIAFDRETQQLSDAQFRDLYMLDAREILADGS